MQSNLFFLEDGDVVSLDEGVIRAHFGQEIDNYKIMGSTIVDIFKDAEQNAKEIQEDADDLIAWMKSFNETHDNPSLEMGKFKTWLKTSEYTKWMYYFMLHDATFNKICEDIKKGEKSKLSEVFNLDMESRKEATALLDNCKSIDELVSYVEKYKKRTSQVIALLKQKQEFSKMVIAPLVRGFMHLSITVKKICRLAV